MTRGFYIGQFVNGIIIQIIFLFFISQFGLDHMNTTSLVFQLMLMGLFARSGMKKNRELDERGRYLVYKTLAIAFIFFLAAALILTDMRQVKIFGNEIRDILGFILLPLFFIIWGITGIVVTTRES